jgi:peptidoglycan/LPS O-acetylase OafA/YrhL
MYVLHWPIHRAGQVWLTDWVVGGTPATRPLHLLAYIAANLVLSTVAAVLAWHLVERRFLALKDVWARRASAQPVPAAP